MRNFHFFDDKKSIHIPTSFEGKFFDSDPNDEFFPSQLRVVETEKHIGFAISNPVLPIMTIINERPRSPMQKPGKMGVPGFRH